MPPPLLPGDLHLVVPPCPLLSPLEENTAPSVQRALPTPPHCTCGWLCFILRGPVWLHVAPRGSWLCTTACWGLGSVAGGSWAQRSGGCSFELKREVGLHSGGTRKSHWRGLGVRKWGPDAVGLPSAGWIKGPTHGTPWELRWRGSLTPRPSGTHRRKNASLRLHHRPVPQTHSGTLSITCLH